MFQTFCFLTVKSIFQEIAKTFLRIDVSCVTSLECLILIIRCLWSLALQISKRLFVFRFFSQKWLTGHILEIQGSVVYWPKRALIYENRPLILKKGFQKIHTPPYSILFLSVLHQQKALHNFCKKGQRSIVKRNIGLKYALAHQFFL